MRGKIVITGGGTGGHVFPALAIANELKRRNYSILYVGTRRGMEASHVPKAGIPFFTVKVGAVKNRGIVKIITSLFQAFTATCWAIVFLLRERPQAVIGVGGYVSVPVCLAAAMVRIPMYLQEQNVSVGISNRFLGKLARTIFLGFEDAAGSFPESKCIYSGNPLREEFRKFAVPDINPETMSLLVIGGSQGARAINYALVTMLEELLEKFPDLFIRHQTGTNDFGGVLQHYQQYPAHRFDVQPFLDEMPKMYSEATLVVCRAGALTVSELIQTKRPAIFVPYPRSGQNDQTANAYMVRAAGAGKVVEQGKQFEERLKDTIFQTLDPKALFQMSLAYSKLRSPNALVTIGDRIESDLH